MNKITSIILTLLICISSVSFSQSTEELKSLALKDAKTTSKATLAMDFETVIKHTYPAVIDVMGGKENAITLIKTTFETMKTQGFVFERADVKRISDIIKEQGEYRCYVENYNQMKMNDMLIKSKSYLLGIYNEDAKIWYFLEAKQLKNQQMMDVVLPNFETALVIPDDEVTTEKI